MSFFRQAFEYFFRQIKTMTKWDKYVQTAKKNWENAQGFPSAFYFFDLEQGGKLIALFGALISLVKTCWIYYLVYQSDIKSLFPDPEWVYVWQNGRKNYLGYHHTHYQFHLGLYFVTFLNSTMLYLGIKWAYVVFLYFWIYISLFTWTMTHVNNGLTNFQLSRLIYMIFSMVFEYYLIALVVSLIWKIRTKQKSGEVEIKEPALEIEEE